jgi:hypothetical protein
MVCSQQRIRKKVSRATTHDLPFVLMQQRRYDGVRGEEEAQLHTPMNLRTMIESYRTRLLDHKESPIRLEEQNARE